MPLILKTDAEKQVVGYNGRSLPLGSREDLDKLAIIALESGDKSLLGLFESIPTLEELKAAKVATELPKLKKPPVTKFPGHNIKESNPDTDENQ